MSQNFHSDPSCNSPSSERTDSQHDPEQFSAKQLYEKCRAVGMLALKSRREFIGLLPLVERRRAYLGRGLYSVYDFAAKLGGISRDIVTEVLRLDQQLEDFGVIRRLLYSGQVGWTKIRLVAGWITTENQDEWAGKLRSMSRASLEIYLRDIDRQQKNTFSLFDNPSVPLTFEKPMAQLYINEKTGEIKAENFPGEISEYDRETHSSQLTTSQPVSKFEALTMERETFSFSLNRQLAAKMRLFRQKLEKERREMITWEEVMAEFLKHVEGEIVTHTNKPASNAVIKCEVEQNEASSAVEHLPAHRYIPTAIRREVTARYNGLCVFQNCVQPAEIFHHTRRFSLVADHDPNFIKPLCKPHERIIHTSLVENEEVDPSHWKLLDSPDVTTKKYAVDQIVVGYRKPK